MDFVFKMLFKNSFFLGISFCKFCLNGKMWGCTCPAFPPPLARRARLLEMLVSAVGVPVSAHHLTSSGHCLFQLLRKSRTLNICSGTKRCTGGVAPRGEILSVPLVLCLEAQPRGRPAPLLPESSLCLGVGDGQEASDAASSSLSVDLI